MADQSAKSAIADKIKTEYTDNPTKILIVLKINPQM